MGRTLIKNKTYCNRCRFINRNWNPAFGPHCDIGAEQKWSWVDNENIKSKTRCTMMNTKGECSNFQSKWRFRDIFTSAFWRKENGD